MVIYDFSNITNRFYLKKQNKKQQQQKSLKLTQLSLHSFCLSVSVRRLHVYFDTCYIIVLPKQLRITLDFFACFESEWNVLENKFVWLVLCCCCCCLFVFLICICILCLLPCLTIVKFVRCSFIVFSCTPIGVSEINYMTYLTCRCCVPCLPNKPEACHSSDWHRPVHHVVWRPSRGNCFLSLPSYR